MLYRVVRVLFFRELVAGKLSRKSKKCNSSGIAQKRSMRAFPACLKCNSVPEEGALDD